MRAPEQGEPLRVVIVGAGFGGLQAALSLARTGAAITLIDRSNHHVFQPLLYQVATATLSPADIAWPIRRVLRRYRNVTVIMDELLAVDREAGVVRTRSGSYAYDRLILATGARHAYFGHDEWRYAAPGLKSLADATRIREQVLTAFERAELEPDPEERARMLTFIVVGGGATGVELAGALVELARETLPDDYRNIDPSTARVILLEAGERILSTYAPKLSQYAAKALEQLGVELRLGAMVTGCDARGVTVGGDEPLPAATVLWAAGVEVPLLGELLDVPTDRAGRVQVTDRLTLPDDDHLFVIGDAAHVVDARGTVVPGIAPGAKQQGAYVGRVISAGIKGRKPPGPFVYRDRGQLATIGRNAAVAGFGRLRLTGRLAWWFWGVVHIYFLISNRSRLIVALQWFWAYAFKTQGARLIVGVELRQRPGGKARLTR